MSRRAYIDWARGIAVLLMIEAHTLDAWTRPAARHGDLYREATVLSGFAAPLFLWLAGAAVVLAATRAAVRSGSRTRGVEIACRRGLEIFLLAFLFRLQGFIVTPGGAPVTLFKVDVLNIMGPSMVGVGLLWGAGRTVAGRVAGCAAAATAVAMLTPIVRATALVGALPVWLQWYVRPSGDLTIFTLFPWAGFVFAGGAVGAVLAEAGDDRVERRLHIVLGAAGAGLIALGFYAAGRPSIYCVASFWTSSPTWFAIRVGILMVAVAAVYGLFAALPHSHRRREGNSLTIDPLARLGRSSLFVYWIHVELVYGYTSWLIRGRLPLWGTALAYVIFCALMYGAIVLRDRLAVTWRARRVGSTTQTATA
jgi:uncharacterized membrane protein